MRYLATLLALLLASPVVAQVVRVVNHAPTSFTGWRRVTVDVDPPADAGRLDGVLYVVGRQVGLDTHIVDLHVTLHAGERKALDLSDAKPAKFDLPPPSGVDWTGGKLKLNNAPMRWVSFKPDGAAWLVHMRARTGRMMCTDVWLRHYPGQPWAEGEAMVTASNPAVPEVFEDAKQRRLSFGDGIVMGAGRQFWQPLVDPTRFAGGQGPQCPLIGPSRFWREMASSDSSRTNELAGLLVLTAAWNAYAHTLEHFLH